MKYRNPQRKKVKWLGSRGTKSEGIERSEARMGSVSGRLQNYQNNIAKVRTQAKVNRSFG